MPLSETLAAMLSGGDRRSMGRSDAAVKLVLQSLPVLALPQFLNTSPAERNYLDTRIALVFHTIE
jgi:hypothetical protein